MLRNGSPLVSVTIPMYNNERYIAETIESVLAQTMPDFELLIYDDHSTDRSLEIARSYDDRRITVFTSEKNLGPEANWNRSVSRVRGRYVKLLCADDLLFPECLEKQCAAYELPGRERVSLVSSSRTIIDYEGKTLINKVGFIDDGLQNPPEVVRKMVRMGTNIIGEPVCGLYPASLIPETSGYSARIPYTTDLDFWVQLLRLGNLWMIDEPLCAFRISSRSWSSRIGSMRHEQFVEFMNEVALDEGFQVNDLDLFIGRFNSAVQSMTSLMGFKLFAGSASQKRVIPVT